MKKKHFLLLCICLWTFSIFSQPTDYKIHLSAVVTPATCQGNGEIHCSITCEPELDIEQVRYFYIPLSGIDSIVETSLSHITHLRPGGYKVKVTAMCGTGLTGEHAHIILSDSINELVVGSDYTIPYSWMIYNIYAFSAPYGIVPSFACAPTGKMQIKIQHGTFPYHLDIWKITDSDTLFYRSVTFDTNMYQGSDSLRHDFKDYYTIDNLEVGKYRILCSDGCGYYMPFLEASIPKVRYYDSRDFHLLRNSSGIPESRNIITIKEIRSERSFAGHNDDYYRQDGQNLNPYYYRFVNPTLAEGVYDTTQWLLMPSFDEHLFIYDTLSQLNSYGDIWGREFLLQLQPACQDTLFSYPFTIYNQGGNMAALGQRNENRVEIPFSYDFCGKTNTLIEYDAYNVCIACEHVLNLCADDPDTLNCRNWYGYTLSGGIVTQGPRYHNYITLPIKCKITNLSQDTLISFDTWDQNDYRWQKNLLENLDYHNESILVEITDALDNPLLSAVKQYPRFDRHYRIGGEYREYDWLSWDEDPEDTYFCPDSPHSLGIYQKYGEIVPRTIEEARHYTFERDTIRIIESPDGGKYNFTGTFDASGNIAVTNEREDNNALVERVLYRLQSGMIYPGVRMTARNLLPGRYVWVVNKPCLTNDTIIQNFDYDLPEVKEAPKYRLDTTCTALNITPIQGQYAIGDTDVETFFQVYTGDTMTHTASAVHKNETISIGIPGSYRIGMYSLPKNNELLISENPCYIVDTTIIWNNETIILDYIYGHVCNAEDEEGFVHVKGKYGLKPYTYTLYSAADGGGSVIASNHNGVFDHVPVRFNQTVSVELTDACNAHFITNLTISDMDKVRKCWSDGNQNSVSLVLGDTCHLYGLSLGGVTYHWNGPDGFSSEEQNVSVIMENESKAGIYRLNLEGSGCGILQDSVVVRVQERPCPQAVDYDGNIYEAVRINGICWTQRNLRSTHYSDGRQIDTAYIYEHLDFTSEQMVDVFGMLYDWASATDTGHIRYVDEAGHIQGICPEGWYLPTREQYERLGQWGAPALRSETYWINGAAGNNATGFSALPAGFYNGTRKRYENLLGETRFWSANPDNFSEIQHTYSLHYYCDELMTQEETARNAYSIRCILAE